MIKDNYELAVLFSGGTDSLALYALATAGHHPDIPRPRRIHLLHMLNGMSRFHDFPRNRYEVGRDILERQFADGARLPRNDMEELDMGRLFQGLWLDRYEKLMPRYNGKNLVCVACKLAMHARAILYCMENFLSLLLVGYTKKQNYFPEQTPEFMDKVSELSAHFGINTIFPLYEECDNELVTRHILEDFGLPSTGGGERKCLFCQTLSTATEREIGHYLDDMVPRLIDYLEKRMAGRVREAAHCFLPGNQGEG